MNLSALDFRQNLRIVTMFLIVQFLALFFATYVYSGASLVVVSSFQYTTSVTTILTAMVIIALGGAVIVLLIKFNTDMLLILLEAIVTIVWSLPLFLVIIGLLTNSLDQILYSSAISYQYGVAFLMAVLLVLAKRRWPRLRNSASIIASTGVALTIGIGFSFGIALLFMALLAVYDFIAVFITKHMVTMATKMASMNLSFLIGTAEGGAVPTSQLSTEERKQSSQVRQALQQQHHSILIKDLDKRKMAPIMTPRLLGNGDLAIPAMVAVSAYKVLGSFSLSIVVVGGATLGLIATFYILNRYRRPLPAIPPLFFGIIFALIIYALLGGLPL